MTQPAAEPKNVQNFEKIAAVRFTSYDKAHDFAVAQFESMTGEKKESDFSGPNHRVRIRLRAPSPQGKQNFDVVSYRRLGQKAAPAPEPTPAETQPIVPKAEKTRVKAKDRRAQEKKTV